MGLDQHLYRVVPGKERRVELAYWRKHYPLHQWMEAEWNAQGRPGESLEFPGFNGVDVVLTVEVLQRLVAQINKDRDKFEVAEYTEKVLHGAIFQAFTGATIVYNGDW